MKDKYVVGLCGRAGSGKDSIADVLVEDGFVKMAFADPIKEILRAYFKVSPQDLLDKPPRVRKALQQLGTEIGREFDPLIWVRWTKNRIDTSTANKIVISDVRFPNEAEMLSLSYDADLIKVIRPSKMSLDGELGAHASENSLSGIAESLITATFYNHEDALETFKREVCNFIQARVK